MLCLEQADFDSEKHASVTVVKPADSSAGQGHGTITMDTASNTQVEGTEYHAIVGETKASSNNFELYLSIVVFLIKGLLS